MENYVELYNLWLQKCDDPTLKAELEAINGKDDEILDRFYKKMEFGTAGLRGVLGAGTNRMNIYTVNQATQGIADYLNATFENPSVAIAYDSRINSDVFAKETAAVSEQTEFYVGDIVQDGDKQIVYMASGEYESDNEFIQPADGNKFIFLQFAVINTSNKSDSGISFYDFNCYADGYEAEMHYDNDDDLSATLSAGRATSGYVYFEVPENAENIEVEYEVNIWTDEKIKFIYEGDKDSGYVLPKNEEASEDAYEVGNVIETKSLRITYLSCEDYESDNMFVTPRDGYHFVCAIFEFENISNSDEHVSSMSFDCFADGISCNQSYVKDDDLSATLSSGRKVKGSVVFEIPDKANTVEIEYLDNFWTSGRVVFTVQ